MPLQLSRKQKKYRRDLRFTIYESSLPLGGLGGGRLTIYDLRFGIWDLGF